MRLAHDDSSNDAPQPRPRRRSEPLLALGRSLLAAHLPPWAIVVLVGLAMLLFTLRELALPYVNAVTAPQLDARVAALEHTVEQQLEGLDNALREHIEARIGATHSRCSRELAQTLRVLVDLRVLPATDLPPDLSLCMLLDEKDRNHHE